MSLKKSCSRTMQMRCNILMSMLFFLKMRYTFSREVGILRAKAATDIPLSRTCFCISLPMWTIVFQVLFCARAAGQGHPGMKKAASFFTAYRFEELSICLLSVQKINQIFPACAHAGQILSDNEFRYRLNVSLEYDRTKHSLFFPHFMAPTCM